MHHHHEVVDLVEEVEVEDLAVEVIEDVEDLAEEEEEEVALTEEEEEEEAEVVEEVEAAVEVVVDEVVEEVVEEGESKVFIFKATLHEIQSDFFLLIQFSFSSYILTMIYSFLFSLFSSLFFFSLQHEGWCKSCR